MSAIKRKNNPMSKRVGLWFNHNKAVIVSITDDGEERSIITANMEYYLRYSNATPGDGSPQDTRDNRYWNHVGEYYDKVIAHIRDAEAVLILGPDEAKFELKKRLENLGLPEYSIVLETTSNLTDHQIAKKIREKFPAHSQYDIF
jgi:stalled ribosome rescue protein Dom34